MYIVAAGMVSVPRVTVVDDDAETDPAVSNKSSSVLRDMTGKHG